MSRHDGKRGPQPVRSILEGVLEGLGLTERFAERRLLEEWEEIVGARCAEHCRAVDIADGVLILDGDHGAWRQELTLLFPAIIRKYNERHGEGSVREIRWRERSGRSGRQRRRDGRRGAGRE